VGVKALGQLAGVLVLILAGLVALNAVGPRIAQIIGALVPLVLTVGVVVAVLRVVWWYTR
jgi:hypothetical protein